MNSKKNMATVLAAVLFTGQGFAQGLANNATQNASDAGRGPPVAQQGSGPSATRTSRHHMLHDNAKKSSNPTAKPKPQLKPDYACQDLHVKPMNCPTR
ncbi:hypothetical protein FSO04_02645 [Paraburkholderia madseniana]|uniref:DUF4148 domain-containing protein n=1 Tax=Paraburkholderia madseniana TaxID=2599607 RepID=A0A6N6WNR5_9BURK|nr:hypothetical protein [Paraburkholderia madseniana]KAE8761494.1 hypothetical protein FSO04_02645 [Paraburkholderia madseniana]